MIKLNTPSFIATSAETQTSTKVETLVVNYSSYLGTKEIDGLTVLQGYIQSFLYNEKMNSIMEDVHEDTYFNGNILAELTDIYITKLELLNPNIIFANTL
jgi:hypothetical protein